MNCYCGTAAKIANRKKDGKPFLACNNNFKDASGGYSGGCKFFSWNVPNQGPCAEDMGYTPPPPRQMTLHPPPPQPQQHYEKPQSQFEKDTSETLSEILRCLREMRGMRP